MHDVTARSPDHACLVEATQLARKAGLRVTAHVGEAAGPASIREALRQRRLHLEMALTGNVETGCVPHIGSHPFGELLRTGQSVSLNTDNRTISGTSLSEEYARAAAELNLTHADLAQATERAAHATFLPDEDKARLLKRVQQAWAVRTGG